MDKLKRKCLCSCILVVSIMLISCDAGFDALNTDNTSLTSVDPGIQLNNAIVGSSFGFSNLLCESTIVRQSISPFTGILTCANVNQENQDQMSSNWDSYYGNSVRNTVDIINSTDESSNIHHMARIWKSYSFMIITDSYGDAPYTGAGKAFIEGTAFPEYDSQQEIYTAESGILEELANATAALDASLSDESQDVLYEGDISQWKRFGYSLLLRAAMRLSKVQPDVAEQYVGIAVSGGLMQSNADNAKLNHTSDYQNSTGNTLNGGESANIYLDGYFVDHLQDNNDPRLASIAVRYPGAESGTFQIEENADRSPANQIGMPQGYEINTIESAVESDNVASLYAYSQIDRTRMGDPQAPTFFVTYSQTQLLLAEAVKRDWAQGDAATLYANGIEAHMQQLADYNESTAIDQSDIDNYVQANHLQAGQELEQINTEYWISSFLNGPEAWANFRRSGYPNLEPNPYPGSTLQNEDFIRRFTYPDSELSVNRANVEEAIGRQGADDIGTRIWWDVK